MVIDNVNKAIVCYLKTDIHDHYKFKFKLDELKQLVLTLGINIEDVFIQTRIKPTSNYIFGKGRIASLKDEIARNNISLVIFYNILSSKQRLNLNRLLNCMVIDRMDIVFELFKRGAYDKISLLQIKYAELQRMIPYFKLISHEKFLNEHPFFKSSGEYAYQSKIKAYYKRLSKLDEEINYYFFIKEQRIEKRRALKKPIICLSGYYNAGKTSLFNKLTGSNKEVSEKPFTTLSSKYKMASFQEEFLFVDTIGFVTDMDLNVLKSFSLNMLDIQSADLVVFTVAIDEDIDKIIFKIKKGFEIYRELNVDLNKLMILFTKIDLISENNIISYKERLKDICEPIPFYFISNKNKEQIKDFLTEIKKILSIKNWSYPQNR